MLIEQLEDNLWDLELLAARTVVLVVALFAMQYAFRQWVSDEMKPKRLPHDVWTKFLNNTWKCSWHSFVFVLEIYDLFHLGCLRFVIYPFNDDASILWRPRYGVSMPSSVALLFLLQVSYYLADVIYWVFVNPPPDLVMMSIHHLASGVLILLSGVPWPNAHFWIGGLVILTLHEVSDVILYVAKGMHYLDYTGGDVVLIVFALSWMYFRNVILSMYVVEIWMLEQFWVEWQYWPSVVLLTLLSVLHAVWLYAILRGLFHAFTGGKYVDTRYESLSKGRSPKMTCDQDESTDSLITESIWQRRLKDSKAPAAAIPLGPRKKCKEVDGTLKRISALPGRDFSCTDSPLRSPSIFASLPAVIFDPVKRLKVQ